MKLLNFAVTLTFLCLCMISSSAFAGTADVPAVTAVHLENIVIDGDLSDWPDGLERNYILNHGQAYGPTDIDHADLMTSEDLHAYFMVGYNLATNFLHVAVVVRDDVQANGFGYSSVDGCEIYTEGKRKGRVVTPERGVGFDATKMAAIQYVQATPGGSYDRERPGAPKPVAFRMAGGDVTKTRTSCAVSREGNITIYEWAVELFEHYPDQPTTLEKGMKIGLDVIINDSDTSDERPRERPAWVGWSKYKPYKFFNADTLGEVTLGGSIESMGTLAGKVTDSKARGPFSQFKFEILQNDEYLRQGVSDANGEFKILMPPGSYELKTSPMQGLDAVTLKKVTVRQGKTSSVKLKPKYTRYPDILVKAVEHYKNMKSYTDFTLIELTHHRDGETWIEKIPYSITYQRPDLMRFECLTPTESGGLSQYNDSKMYSIYNNYEELYTTFTSENLKRISISMNSILTWQTDGNSLDFLFILDENAFDTLIKNSVSITEKGEDVFDGRPVSIIEVVKPFDRLNPTSRYLSFVDFSPVIHKNGTIRLLIDKNDYSIREVSYTLPLDEIDAVMKDEVKAEMTGTVDVSLKHMGIEFDREYDTKYFSFMPPGDVEMSNRLTGMVTKVRNKRLVGKPAPDFTLPDLDGNQVKLSDSNGKIRILLFWASWSEGCAEPMKQYSRMSEYFKKVNMDVELIAINVLDEEDPEVLKEYLEENEITLNSLIDSSETLTDSYNLQNFPSCVMIDKDGTISAVYKKASFQLVATALTQMLDLKPE